MVTMEIIAIVLMLSSPILAFIGLDIENGWIWLAGIINLIIGEILNAVYLYWFFTNGGL